MTANKPPIAAWAPSTALAKLASRHNNSPCVLTDGPAEFNDVALVRLSDYEALQVECEKLRQEVEALQGIQPEMPPMPPNGKGLPRYGVRWSGPTQPLSVPKDDGFWTPWHLAQAECEKLRKDAVGLVAALEAIQTTATHKSIRTGIQAGTALGLISSVCDVALAAHRKQGGK